MKRVLFPSQLVDHKLSRRREDLMKRNTKIALVLCFAVLGTASEARAQCKYVHGGFTETIIPSNDAFGRALGNVNGVLNGAITGFITSMNPSPSGVTATSYEVFVTKAGDMLTATCAATLTPVPGAPPGEFAGNFIYTITGGSGKYAGATGTITAEGLGHNVFGGPGVGTFDSIYQGSVCGPNLRANGDED
jgi:hypothetical protein